MTVEPKKVGELIARLRKARDITQAELGERLHVSFQAVSNWERGEALPDTGTLPALAVVLGTSADHLLSGGSREIPFRGKLTAREAMDGVRCLTQLGRLWQKDNPIYQALIDGLGEKMNCDIWGMLEDDFLRECLAAEIVLHNMAQGYYYDVSEIKNAFTHERWVNLLMERAARYHM